MTRDWDTGLARTVIDRHRDQAGPVLPILHALQETFGYVPREAEPMVAEALNLSRAEIHGVVSFYPDFRRESAGRRIVKVCRGEACQSMGGEAMGQALLAAIGRAWGETTVDGALTVEPVYCLGLCAVAPAAMIDGEPHGRLDAKRLVTLALEGGQ